MIGEEGDLT